VERTTREESLAPKEVPELLSLVGPLLINRELKFGSARYLEALGSLFDSFGFGWLTLI